MVSIRFAGWVTVGAVFTALLGCQAATGDATLSQRYRICANLPVGVHYRSAAPGPDFDTGILESEGHQAEVFIGRHPKFAHSVIRKGVTAKAGFELLGRESSDGEERMLFAHDRGDREGPSYVMFMATDLQPMEHVLITKDFLVSCTSRSG